jgi:4-amino-4-deoxy-L-arabinose transferase-like glycosyltransferase
VRLVASCLSIPKQAYFIVASFLILLALSQVRMETTQTTTLTRVEARPELRLPEAIADNETLELSPFVHIGAPAWVFSARHPPGGIWIRSANHPRAFRIIQPSKYDAEVRWRLLEDGASARPWIQLALVSDAETKAHGRLVFQCRAPLVPMRTGALLFMAAMALAFIPRSYARFKQLARLRYELALGAVLIVSLVRLWNWPVTMSDETYIYYQAKGVLERQNWAITGFNYPHLIPYLQTLVTIAHGIARASQGLAYHDPYTNLLYFDGSPLPPRLFTEAFYPNLFLETAIPWVRRVMALLAIGIVFMAYRIGERLIGKRAGLLAALACASQPLLMRAEIFPNIGIVFFALLTVYNLMLGTRSYPRLIVVGFLVGVTFAFKFNPCLLPVFFLIVFLDWKRLSMHAVIIGSIAVALGFWFCYPSLPVAFRYFMKDVAYEAFHYFQAGHRRFETDSPLRAALDGVFCRRPFYGNYVVIAFALLGIAEIVRRARLLGFRTLCILGASFGLYSFFTYRIFVQFGRNWGVPWALLCIMAGLGAESVLSMRLPRLTFGNRILRLFLISVFVAGTAQVAHMMLEYDERGRWKAREDAIAWIDRNAPLGARVALVEPHDAVLFGRLPDQARFRVRRFTSKSEALQNGFDYILSSVEPVNVLHTKTNFVVSFDST